MKNEKKKEPNICSNQLYKRHITLSNMKKKVVSQITNNHILTTFSYECHSRRKFLILFSLFANILPKFQGSFCYLIFRKELFRITLLVHPNILCIEYPLRLYSVFHSTAYISKNLRIFLLNFFLNFDPSHSPFLDWTYQTFALDAENLFGERHPQKLFDSKVICL